MHLRNGILKFIDISISEYFPVISINYAMRLLFKAFRFIKTNAEFKWTSQKVSIKFISERTLFLNNVSHSVNVI